jgi:hypothetical protein
MRHMKANWTEHLVTVHAHRVWADRAAAAMREGLLPYDREAPPDRSPSLEPIAGDVSGYLKTQGGVSKSRGQCEAY